MVALKNLESIGCLSSSRSDAAITKLGRIASSLPIEAGLTRLILVGLGLGCGAEAVVMAAALSADKPIWKLPFIAYEKTLSKLVKEVAKTWRSRDKLSLGTLCGETLVSLRGPMWNSYTLFSFMDPNQRSVCFPCSDFSNSSFPLSNQTGKR